MTSALAADALASLAWLVESGADEAIGQTALNRFADAPNPSHEERSSIATVSSAEARRPALAPAPFRGSASTTLQNPLIQPRGERQSTFAASPDAGDDIGKAIQAAAACKSLAELKVALDAFEGSQLKKNATNTVFADGNPFSRILFIGEAPGRDEDRLGLPFVGRAGKLLDQMLAAIHLDRSRAYITNVLPWRPPDNRNPEATEVAQCIPFLRRHIELAEPGIMILLGAVSLRHVLGLSEGIMKYRGRWMEYRIGERMIPVMPTLHPAYLLRQPAHKKLVWRDLQAVEEKITTLGLNRSSR